MEPAFVLHRWPYQDSSLLVELLSAQQGRFRVIAKGAKRPKSKWRSILQPFTPLLVQAKGRGELLTLSAAEASDQAMNLQGHALYSGFYVNELVQRLTPPHQAIDELFHDYHETLSMLAQASHVEPVLRRFEWQLLCHLGHGFDWHADDQQQPFLAEQTYQFRPERGFFIAAPNALENSAAETPLNPYSAAEFLMTGADITRIAAFEQLDQRLLNLLKRIMRSALQPYLGDKPLRSRQLFTQFKDKS